MAEQLYIYNVCTSVKLLDMCVKQYILTSWHPCYSYRRNLHLSLVMDQLLEIPVDIWLGLSCWTCMPQEVGSTLQIPDKNVNISALKQLHAMKTKEEKLDNWRERYAERNNNKWKKIYRWVITPQNTGRTVHVMSNTQVNESQTQWRLVCVMVHLPSEKVSFTKKCKKQDCKILNEVSTHSAH